MYFDRSYIRNNKNNNDNNNNNKKNKMQKSITIPQVFEV